MPQLSYLLDTSRADVAPKRDRLFRRRLRKILRGLPRVSRRRSDASWTHSLSTLHGWLLRRLRQHKAYNELKARLHLDLQLHAHAMKEALQEAEEKVRVEIALRIEAERKARQEAEARLELERVARQAAERKVRWLSGPKRRAHPEAIAKAEREMISRVKAEQLAIMKVRVLGSRKV